MKTLQRIALLENTIADEIKFRRNRSKADNDYSDKRQEQVFGISDATKLRHWQKELEQLKSKPIYKIVKLFN